jgi:hypothetical protein
VHPGVWRDHSAGSVLKVSRSTRQCAQGEPQHAAVCSR